MHLQLESLERALVALKRIETALVEGGISSVKSDGYLCQMGTRFEHVFETPERDLSLRWYLSGCPNEELAESDCNWVAEAGLVIDFGGLVEIYLIWNAVHCTWELQVGKGVKHPPLKKGDSIFQSELPEAQAGLEFARSIKVSQTRDTISDEMAFRIIAAIIKCIKERKN